MNEQPQQTPMIDLLRAVPKDLRAQWPIQWTEDGHETGHAMCPIGRLAHEAADRIAELEAAHARYAGSESEAAAEEVRLPNLLDRLKAAHEAAQRIPDLEAELRELLGAMGYDLVARSPFVDLTQQEQPK